MKRVLMLAVASILATGTAFAGDFQVWTYADKNGRDAVVSVSFVGDGQTQDAQIDLKIPEGYRVVGSSTKVAGSVCAASAEKGLLRAVPPSGEGKALPSSMMDVCSFKLSATGEKASGKPKIEVAFKECVGASEASCGVQTPDVSER